MPEPERAPRRAGQFDFSFVGVFAGQRRTRELKSVNELCGVDFALGQREISFGWLMLVEVVKQDGLVVAARRPWAPGESW